MVNGKPYKRGIIVCGGAARITHVVVQPIGRSQADCRRWVANTVRRIMTISHVPTRTLLELKIERYLKPCGVRHQ